MKWCGLFLCILAVAFADDPPPTVTTSPSTTTSTTMQPLCTVPTPTPHADHPRPTFGVTTIRFRVSTIEDGKPVDYALYFDFMEKRGQMTKYQGDKQEQHFYEFINLGKDFKISDDTCVVTDVFKPENDKYRASITFLPERLKFPLVGEAETHTIGAKYVFLFGDDIPSEYVDSVTIRGMLTDHWRSCIEEIKVDYYFIDKALDSTVKVPWQIVVTESDLTTTYDITNFGDEKLFELPRGSICDGIAQKNMPTIDDSFALVTEMIFPDEKAIFMIKEYHDYEHKLSRYDFTPNPSHTEGDDSYGHMFGHDNLGVIHQFLGDSSHDTGLEYVLMQNGSCHVRVLNPDLNVGNWNDMRVTNSNDSIQTAMRHGNGFFDLDHAHTTYQGKKHFRNMEADTWAFATDTTHVEVYFTPEQWVGTSDMGSGGESDTKQKLAGIWMKSKNEINEEFQESFSHMVDYLELTHIGTDDHTPFDITQCYQEAAKHHFRIQIAGDFKKYVVGAARYFTDKVIREQMAQAAGVSTIRIMDIDYFFLVENKMDIWMTLFEKPLLSTPVAADGVDPTEDMKSMQLAYKNIDNTLKHDGIKFTFTNPTLVDAQVIPDSLKDAFAEPDPRGNTVTNTGHSNGSMAALGIIMLLLGCFFGLGVGFWLWKRRRGGIPYAVHH